MTTHLQIPDEFDNASTAERIAFVEALWDRIAQHPDAVSVPAHHREVLDQRLDEHYRHPEAGKPWHEVREQLLDKLRHS